jgi:prevent-host-death family protein
LFTKAIKDVIIYLKVNVKINVRVLFTEKAIGIDQIRPRLGEYLEQVEKGNVVIILSRSKPKGVLISYSSYEELKRLSERVKQLEFKAILDEMRELGEKAGITEEDVLAEIEEVRSCGP